MSRQAAKITHLRLLELSGVNEPHQGVGWRHG
jgi:hypothetical protein